MCSLAPSGLQFIFIIITEQIKKNMKNIYLKAFLKTVAGMFSAVLVFTSCTTSTTGELNGHEWVDLGLSVRWATCNVGSSVPSGYGDYYAWGEIETKMEYTEENSVTYGVELGDISGNPQYDVATANWGEGWRMPTKEEYIELLHECDWELTSLDGMLGCKVTGPNGNSIFLPAAGDRYGSSLAYVGEHGAFWSSSPYESGAQGAYALGFDSDGCYVGWCSRYYGGSVRPVSDK